MIHSCDFLFSDSESRVCLEQLNCLLFFRTILQLTQIHWFSSIFVYLNPFQHWLYDFEIHLFTPRTTEGLICNYYRRFKRSLMPQKEKTSTFYILREKPWSYGVSPFAMSFRFLPLRIGKSEKLFFFLTQVLKRKGKTNEHNYIAVCLLSNESNHL